MSNCVLEADHISIGYGATTILSDVTFRLNGGDALGLIGANGSGKSTLLKGILGLCNVDGKVIRDGEIGYVPQRQEVDPTFPVSARGVVEMGLYASTPWWRRVDAAKVDAALKLVDLQHKQHDRFGALSGGQRQRILIARAVVTKPALILLDEPFNGLDSTSRDVLIDTMHALKRQGTAIIVSTHDYSLAEEVCEQSGIVADGHVEISTTSEALARYVA